jgi:hypothetical protein
VLDAEVGDPLIELRGTETVEQTVDVREPEVSGQPVGGEPDRPLD